MFVERDVSAIALRQEGHVIDPCACAIALRQDGHVLIMPLPSVDALQTNMNMELLTELEPSSPMYYKHGTPGGFLFAVSLSPRRPS